MSDEEFIGVQAPKPENTNDELSTPETEGWIKDSLAALQTPEPLTNQQVQDLYKVTNPSALQKILKVEQSKISDYNSVASKLPKGISKDTLEAKKEAASVNIDIIKDRLAHLDKNVIVERTKLAEQRIKDEDLPDYIKDEYQHYIQQLRELKKNRGKKELPKSLSGATDRKTTFFKNWSTRGVDNAIKQFVKAKQEEQQKQQKQDELNFKIAEARDEIGWRDDEDLKEEVRMRPKEERFEGLSFKKLKEERTKVGFEKFLDAGVNKQASIKQTELGGLTEQVLPEPMELPTAKASDRINREKDKRKEDKRDIKATEDMLRKADDRLFKLFGAKDDKKEKHTSFWAKVGQVANEILKLVTIFSGLALWKWLSSDDPTVDTENKTDTPKETPEVKPEPPVQVKPEPPKPNYKKEISPKKKKSVKLPWYTWIGFGQKAAPLHPDKPKTPPKPQWRNKTGKTVDLSQFRDFREQGGYDSFKRATDETKKRKKLRGLSENSLQKNEDFYMALFNLKRGERLVNVDPSKPRREGEITDWIGRDDKGNFIGEGLDASFLDTIDTVMKSLGGDRIKNAYAYVQQHKHDERDLSADDAVRELPLVRTELGSTNVEDITKIKTINAPRSILPAAMSSQIDNVSTTASSYVFNKENKVDVSKQLNQASQTIRDTKFRRGNPDTKIELPMRANGTGQAELQTL